jgi:hypothetical protein
LHIAGGRCERRFPGWSGWLLRGSLYQLTINARVQGNVDKPLLEWERRVAGGDWQVPKAEVSRNAEWYHQQADQKADKESHFLTLSFSAQPSGLP